tara:strand:- start:37 stop:141 length:105 start_codon:yes stop_codon:yes gene_type:complete
MTITEFRKSGWAKEFSNFDEALLEEMDEDSAVVH